MPAVVRSDLALDMMGHATVTVYTSRPPRRTTELFKLSRLDTTFMGGGRNIKKFLLG